MCLRFPETALSLVDMLIADDMQWPSSEMGNVWTRLDTDGLRLGMITAISGYTIFGDG